LSFIDFHSHLLPGVDDGARTVAESVTAMERLMADGAEAAITTPHFQGSLTLERDRLSRRLAELDRGWDALRSASGRLPLELYRGVEVMLDVPDPRLEDPRLRIAGGDLVLVEFPYMTVPPGATRPFSSIRASGLIPVLAHPERYSGMGATPAAAVADARHWRDAGAYLQVNGPALLGRYGDGPRRRAIALLEAGLVDYLGSDYHARGDTSISDYRAIILEQGHVEALTLLTDTNLRRMLESQPPLPVPPIRFARSWIDSLLRR
jgi:protein-tyrosine phosphatase